MMARPREVLLSSKQREMVALIEAGRSTKEIAHQYRRMTQQAVGMLLRRAEDTLGSAVHEKTEANDEEMDT